MLASTLRSRTLASCSSCSSMLAMRAASTSASASDPKSVLKSLQQGLKEAMRAKDKQRAQTLKVCIAYSLRFNILADVSNCSTSKTADSLIISTFFFYLFSTNSLLSPISNHYNIERSHLQRFRHSFNAYQSEKKLWKRMPPKEGMT